MSFDREVQPSATVRPWDISMTRCAAACRLALRAQAMQAALRIFVMRYHQVLPMLLSGRTFLPNGIGPFTITHLNIRIAVYDRGDVIFAFLFRHDEYFHRIYARRGTPCGCPDFGHPQGVPLQGLPDHHVY